MKRILGIDSFPGLAATIGNKTIRGVGITQSGCRWLEAESETGTEWDQGVGGVIPLNGTAWLVAIVHCCLFVFFAGNEGTGCPRLPRHHSREPWILEEWAGRLPARDPDNLRWQTWPDERRNGDLLQPQGQKKAAPWRHTPSYAHSFNIEVCIDLEAHQLTMVSDVGMIDRYLITSPETAGQFSACMTAFLTCFPLMSSCKLSCRLDVLVHCSTEIVFQIYEFRSQEKMDATRPDNVMKNCPMIGK